MRVSHVLQATMVTLTVLSTGCGSSTEVSPPPLVGILIDGVSPQYAGLNIGGTIQLHAVGLTAPGVSAPATLAATWSSSDSTIISVTQTGAITGRRLASAIIRATVRNAGTLFTDSVTINIVDIRPADRGPL